MKYYQKPILRNGLITILILSFSVFLYGQRFDLELGHLSGKIFKHKKGLLYNTPEYTQAFEINLFGYTEDSNGWEKFWNYPRFEGTLVHVIFGDKEVLGTATGILPSVALHLKQWSESRLMFHFGTGLAYLNKKFDPNLNPTNNAIGSHLNNVTRFKIRYEHSLKNNAAISFAFNFLHFSNGLSSSPNSGINIAGAQIGFSTRLTKSTIKQYPTYTDTTSYNKWGGEFQTTYSAIENGHVPGGPKYSVYSFSAGIYWRYKRYLRMVFGLNYEYNDRIFNFFISGFAPEEEARKLATKTSFYLGHEIYFGRISFRNQIGYYLPFPLSEGAKDIYYKMDINFYFMGYDSRFSPYLGVELKTHYFKADYIALLIGIKI